SGRPYRSPNDISAAGQAEEHHHGSTEFGMIDQSSQGRWYCVVQVRPPSEVARMTLVPGARAPPVPSTAPTIQPRSRLTKLAPEGKNCASGTGRTSPRLLPPRVATI